MNFKNSSGVDVNLQNVNYSVIDMAKWQFKTYYIEIFQEDWGTLEKHESTYLYTLGLIYTYYLKFQNVSFYPMARSKWTDVSKIHNLEPFY